MKKVILTNSPANGTWRSNDEKHIEIFIDGKLEESFITFRKGTDAELVAYYQNVYRSRYILQ